MTGRAGTGFVLDTNALHHGVLKGSRERLVVVLEFNQVNKSKTLNAGRGSFPCPSSASNARRVGKAPCAVEAWAKTAADDHLRQALRHQARKKAPD